MSAYKTQTLGNHPKERIQHLEQGEGLKSRMEILYPTKRATKSRVGNINEVVN
jgi:hypothetical protein